MKLNWNYPVTLWPSENRINDLIEACKVHDIKNPLFVSDKEKIDLDKLSLMAFEDPSTSGNLRILTKKDMKILYEHSITGKLF